MLLQMIKTIESRINIEFALEWWGKSVQDNKRSVKSFEHIWTHEPSIVNHAIDRSHEASRWIESNYTADGRRVSVSISACTVAASSLHRRTRFVKWPTTAHTMRVLPQPSILCSCLVAFIKLREYFRWLLVFTLGSSVPCAHNYLLFSIINILPMTMH